MNLELEKEVVKFINDQIIVKTKKLEESNKIYKSLIKELITIVDNNLAHNKEILEQFKEDELTINAIEAEGAVRGLIKAKNDFIDELGEAEYEGMELLKHIKTI